MSKIHNDKSRVIVLGAGFVGVCTAISLVKRGLDVVLIDRLPAGSETSHGNAGVICDMGIHPMASPELIREFPRLLFNRDPRFLLQYAELPRLAPWIIDFIGNCNQQTMESSTEAIAPICLDALSRHQKLMRLAGCQELLNETGWLRAYRSQSGFAKACTRIRDFDRHGISYEILDQNRIIELEPDLGFHYPAAIWMNKTHTITNPALLCKKYFDYFISQGGEFIQQSIDSIAPKEGGWSVITGQQTIKGSRLVIALGAWSNILLKPLGARLPYVLERGYHMMFEPPTDQRLNRSLVDVEFGFVLSPLQTGIRVTTGANLVATDKPPDHRQLDRLMPHIRKTLAVGKPLLEKPWMGRRASTADSLPIIGPIDSLPGLTVATGHCHLGLTLGPVTGELVADEVCGQSNPLCRPFYPSRF